MSDSVPDGLADTPTGPGLCTLLGLVELSGVADDRLGDLLVAEARQLAYQQARVWAVMAEIGSRDPMANVPGAVPWPVEQIVESAVEEVCDLDHHHDHAKGGRTQPENLAPGCRHDHGLKTDHGWRLVKRGNGTYLWISRLGRTHLAHVDPVAPPLPQPLPRQHAREPDPPPF